MHIYALIAYLSAMKMASGRIASHIFVPFTPTQAMGRVRCPVNKACTRGVSGERNMTGKPERGSVTRLPESSRACTQRVTAPHWMRMRSVCCAICLAGSSLRSKRGKSVATAAQSSAMRRGTVPVKKLFMRKLPPKNVQQNRVIPPTRKAEMHSESRNRK